MPSWAAKTARPPAAARTMPIDVQRRRRRGRRSASRWSPSTRISETTPIAIPPTKRIPLEPVGGARALTHADQAGLAGAAQLDRDAHAQGEHAERDQHPDRELRHRRASPEPSAVRVVARSRAVRSSSATSALVCIAASRSLSGCVAGLDQRHRLVGVHLAGEPLHQHVDLLLDEVGHRLLVAEGVVDGEADPLLVAAGAEAADRLDDPDVARRVAPPVRCEHLELREPVEHVLRERRSGGGPRRRSPARSRRRARARAGDRRARSAPWRGPGPPRAGP